MSDPNLQEQLARLANGDWYTQTIYVAAKLRIAELLRNLTISVLRQYAHG